MVGKEDFDDRFEGVIEKSEGFNVESKLKVLATVVGGIEKARDLISSGLQLERLKELADKNPFANIVYFQLISHLNYAMLENENAPETIEMPGEYVNGLWVSKKYGAIVIAQNQFPTTFEGRLSAMAQSFRHAGNKCDDMLSLANLKDFTMSVAMVTDIVKSTVSASRVQQFQPYPGLPPGYGVVPKAGYRLVKQKGSNPGQLEARDIPETNPGRPPKKWFNKMVKHVAETDVYNPESVVGDIWYNQLSDSKRKEILKRYE